METRRLVSLVCCLVAPIVLAATDGGTPLASFESDADNPFTASGGTAVRVPENATDGKFSLRFGVKGSTKDTWPGLRLTAPPNHDWATRETLQMDIFLADDKPVQLCTRFDAKGRDPLFGGARLKPGWNRNWAVNLKAMRAATDVGGATALLLYFRIPREDVTIFVDNVRWSTFQARYRRIEYVETAPMPEPTADERQGGFVLWEHSYLRPVFEVSRPAARLERVRLFLARNELEPFAFSVYALRDLAAVRATVTDLRGPGGAVIPASAWDLRVMRYLDRRVTYSSDQYIARFPAYLAPLTAPVAVAADRSRPFQFTLRGPADAGPGLYRGQLNVTAGDQTRTVDLEVRLLPFELPEARSLLYGEYYRPAGRPAAGRERIDADLADMRRQGMTSVGLCFGVDPSSYTRNGEQFVFQFKGDTVFDWFMQTCVALGFPGPMVLLSDSGQAAAAELGAMGTPAYDRAYANFHKALAAACRQQGWPELYVQPVDEPGWQDDDARRRNVYLLKLLKAAGIKTEQDGPGDGYFHHEAGPCADLWNYNGALATAAQTQSALADGRLISFYNNDVEGYRPEVDRWAYGLFNWRWRMHGGFNWEYRGGSGDLYDNLDAEHGDWVHWFLPQGDEPGGPSTGWEGSREGVDDRRYLLLAESLADRAAKAGGAAADLAATVRADLDGLRERLDPSVRVRGRANFTVMLTAAQARRLTGVTADTGAGSYVSGLYKHPNGLGFREYDAIRWLAAWHAWQLLHALGEAPAVPAPAALPAPAATRLTVTAREAGTGSRDQARPAVRVSALAAAPVVDGTVDGDPGWTGAGQVSLALSDGSGRAEAPTTVRFGLHGGTLYVAFECAEPQIDKIVASIRTPDGEVWKDDCVEVFLDPGLTGKRFYQVLVNSLGTVARLAPAGTTWKSAIPAAASVERDRHRWQAELAIPVADLKLGARFGLNFGRERRPLEILELSSWAATGQTFAQPERFGIAQVDGDLPATAPVPVALGLTLEPGYALTTDAGVEITFDLPLPAAALSQATVALVLEGAGQRVAVDLPRPLAERLRARLATGDLPPGAYALTAAVTGVEPAPPPATVRHTRLPAPW